MPKKRRSTPRRATAQEAGLTLFDIKRRRGSKGSQYDARSIKGIRTKTVRRKKSNTTKSV